MSNRLYDPKRIEPYWQAQWQRRRTFTTRGSGKPIYILEMFPYPSGNLHMGHVRNYTIGDVFARFHRMAGRDVLHPMGWDALGLPAENQAIKEGVAPQVRTPANIAQMKQQMVALGLAYDWDRELATYTPEYYRWNQWFFLRLLERDLVYRRESQVNWCTGCNTVLANEQVSEERVCWRGHEGVGTRMIPEWAFRITRYAEALLADLDTLTDWPQRIVAQQRHWLGKSEGARVSFGVSGRDDSIDIFTTRLDTIYGCTYLVLAPEHALVPTVTSAAQSHDVLAFVTRMKAQDTKDRTAVGAEKQGVFTGSYAENPFTHERIPIWLANFVVADYGTGAVMSVPAHDQRDFEFAQKYGLPIRAVVWPGDGALTLPLVAASLEDGTLKDCGEFSGLSSAAARTRMAKDAKDQGFGEPTIQWHLRDWGFSRQRYWGTPIPIIYCHDHGAVPVPESSLPVRLPDFRDVSLTGEGGAPLGKLPAFYETTCPKCQKPARREVETMDTFVDSAWYYARFLSPKDDTRPFAPELAARWLPVDIYVGGPEHAVMHLLYFRFWHKVMRELGLVRCDEPVRRLITQGMVNAPAFRCATHGYVRAQAGDTCPTCQLPLAQAVEKMSKSKYNGIDPMELITKYGADTARVYTLFAAPPEKDLEWNPAGVEGAQRFLARIARIVSVQEDRVSEVRPQEGMAGLDEASAKVRQALHRTIAKVTLEVGERHHFNTAVASMMELVNVFFEHGLHEGQGEPRVVLEALLRTAQMLSPFAPHLAEDIWARSGGSGLVAESGWPEADPQALVESELTLVVQVNGKLRAQLKVPAQHSEASALAQARQDPAVARHLEGKIVRKEVYVPGRLINFVVS